MKTFPSNAITASSAALLATLTFSAHAQSPSRDLADPRMPVPALRYQSAFENYQPPSEETPAPAKNWRATNENIARNGGMAMGMGMGREPGGTSMQMNGMKHDMKGMKEDEMKGMRHGEMKGMKEGEMKSMGHGGATDRSMKGMRKDDAKGTMSMPMNEPGKGVQNMKSMPDDPSQKR